MQKAEQKKHWQQLLEHLPENIRQIWHALGGHEKGRLEDLWRLLETYGGQTIRVPATIPAERHHPLLRRLGKRCTGKLVAAFGGTPVYVPRCTSVLTKLRQQEIIETFSRHTARGTSSTAAVACLARRHGLSDRQIWNILKKVTSAPAQGYLLHELK
ncbi:MAG: Mor transcription activator family protein [Desulfovibrio sp.]|nr:Mor transcription activator family protein [Desulfovibrio sp.]